MGYRGKQRGIVVAGSIAIAALTAGCSSSNNTTTPASSMRYRVLTRAGKP